MMPVAEIQRARLMYREGTVREPNARSGAPTASPPRPSCPAINDPQSVKCLGVCGPRGHDGAKKLARRKRVALVNAEGHILPLAVVPSNVQDRDTLTSLNEGKEAWPSLRLAILDGALKVERCREWSYLHGMRHHVIEEDPHQKGCIVLERRWVVECTFGWLSHWGGLLRKRAGRGDVAAGRLACSACLMAVTALHDPDWDRCSNRFVQVRLQAWTKEPGRFRLDPSRHILGLYT